MVQASEDRTSICQHCKHEIHWVPDDDTYGWWYTKEGWNLCPGTDEGYHRPGDADMDNEPPAWRVDASFYVRAATSGTAYNQVRRMLEGIPSPPSGVIGPADDIHDNPEPWDMTG